MSNSLVVPNYIVSTDTTDDKMIDLFVAIKRSKNTRALYIQSIIMLISFMQKPLDTVTLPDAFAYHAMLKEQYPSLHSIKTHLNIAKSLFSFGVKVNYLRTNVFAPLTPDTPSEITHKRILTEEQVLRLLDIPKRERDRLLLRLIYAAGLRVSEACGLTWGDLLPTGVLHVRVSKGQEQRFVTISESMVEKLNALRDYAAADEPIFKSQKGGQLHKSAVHRIIKKAAKEVGISEEASAHWLRHSHASHALDRGASIVTVRDTLGHKNVATTNKYLHSKRKDSSALYLAV